MKQEYKEAYDKTLQENNVILLGVGGSAQIGLASPDSDEDEVGIYIEKYPAVCGFDPTNFVEFRTARIRTGVYDAKSETGDLDLTLYGLKKYVLLACGGNPNLLTLLYLSGDLLRGITPIGKELQALTPHIVNRGTVKAFLGYAEAQKERLYGNKGQKRINRPDLEEAYGYDTKYAMHVVRLLIQALQLIKTGKLTFPLANLDSNYLAKIKNGSYSLQDVNSVIRYYEDQIKLQDIGLPEKPNYKLLEDWVLSTYKTAWR